jgi:hypothetical protein
MSLPFAKAMPLVAGATLLLWRALSWIRRHLEMLRARAPIVPMRALPGTATGAKTTPVLLPPPPIQAESIQHEAIDLSPEAASEPAQSREAAILAWQEESPSAASHPTETRYEPKQFHIDEENNADPIDGMLLLPGETTIRCACGLVYRMESLQWLEQQLGGDCVQCHARVRAPMRQSQNFGDS